jgi:hypothetical protein
MLLAPDEAITAKPLSVFLSPALTVLFLIVENPGHEPGQCIDVQEKAKREETKFVICSL